jgi:hypothetical protein
VLLFEQTRRDIDGEADYVYYFTHIPETARQPYWKISGTILVKKNLTYQIRGAFCTPMGILCVAATLRKVLMEVASQVFNRRIKLSGAHKIFHLLFLCINRRFHESLAAVLKSVTAQASSSCSSSTTNISEGAGFPHSQGGFYPAVSTDMLTEYSLYPEAAKQIII